MPEIRIPLNRSHVWYWWNKHPFMCIKGYAEFFNVHTEECEDSIDLIISDKHLKGGYKFVTLPHMEVLVRGTKVYPVSEIFSQVIKDAVPRVKDDICVWIRVEVDNEE